MISVVREKVQRGDRVQFESVMKMFLSASKKMLLINIMEVIFLLPGATILLLIALAFEILFICEGILQCTFHNLSDSRLRYPALCVVAAVPVLCVWLLLDKWQSCFERQS